VDYYYLPVAGKAGQFLFERGKTACLNFYVFSVPVNSVGDETRDCFLGFAAQGITEFQYPVEAAFASGSN
jgi:hypothetical protein